MTTIPRGIHEILLLQNRQKWHISCHQIDSFKLKMLQHVVTYGPTLDPTQGACDTPTDLLDGWGCPLPIPLQPSAP